MVHSSDDIFKHRLLSPIFILGKINGGATSSEGSYRLWRSTLHRLGFTGSAFMRGQHLNFTVFDCSFIYSWKWWTDVSNISQYLPFKTHLFLPHATGREHPPLIFMSPELHIISFYLWPLTYQSSPSTYT